jgi:hypothetical protein
MSDSIKKIGIPMLVVTSVLVLTAPMLLTGAYARPTLHAGDCTVVNDNLVCEFDVSGLGGATTATGTHRGCNDYNRLS